MVSSLPRRAALATAAAAGLLPARPSCAADPVRIGVILPLSGASADYGSRIRAGAEIAARQVNDAGGVLGRPIELLVRDDRGRPNDAIAAARELLGLGVSVFAACTISATMLAVAPVIAAANGLMMNLQSVVATLSHEDFRPNYFRLTSSGYTVYRATARAMAINRPDVKRWAMIVTDNASGYDIVRTYRSGLSEFYRERTGEAATLLEPILVSPEASDFKLQLAQLMALPAEGLVCGLLGARQVTLASQGRTVGWDQKFRVFNDINQELTLALAMGKSMPKDWWSGCFWYYGDGRPESKALNDAYVAQTGAPFATAQVGIGHSAVKLLSQAIGAAGSTDTQALVGALEAGEFDTLIGRIRYRSDHQPVTTLGMVEMGGDANAPLGFRVAEYTTVQLDGVIEPSTPGRKAED